MSFSKQASGTTAASAAIAAEVLLSAFFIELLINDITNSLTITVANEFLEDRKSACL